MVTLTIHALAEAENKEHAMLKAAKPILDENSNLKNDCKTTITSPDTNANNLTYN